ncbi:hypothetical protein MMA231_03606 (plasmid) [Asticcacaulis sp. MM231]|uniref:hypothetical protein n=1 Tax=Asticcacaulis sp. MM231 TaxID=3157666 RepID=UPI0032D58885
MNKTHNPKIPQIWPGTLWIAIFGAGVAVAVVIRTFFHLSKAAPAEQIGLISINLLVLAATIWGVLSLRESCSVYLTEEGIGAGRGNRHKFIKWSDASFQWRSDNTFIVKKGDDTIEVNVLLMSSMKAFWEFIKTKVPDQSHSD